MFGGISGVDFWPTLPSWQDVTGWLQGEPESQFQSVSSNTDETQFTFYYKDSSKSAVSITIWTPPSHLKKISLSYPSVPIQENNLTKFFQDLIKHNVGFFIYYLKQQVWNDFSESEEGRCEIEDRYILSFSTGDLNQDKMVAERLTYSLEQYVDRDPFPFKIKNLYLRQFLDHSPTQPIAIADLIYIPRTNIAAIVAAQPKLVENPKFPRKHVPLIPNTSVQHLHHNLWDSLTNEQIQNGLTEQQVAKLDTRLEGHLNVMSKLSQAQVGKLHRSQKAKVRTPAINFLSAADVNAYLDLALVPQITNSTLIAGLTGARAANVSLNMVQHLANEELQHLTDREKVGRLSTEKLQYLTDEQILHLLPKARWSDLKQLPTARVKQIKNAQLLANPDFPDACYASVDPSMVGAVPDGKLRFLVTPDQFRRLFEKQLRVAKSDTIFLNNLPIDLILKVMNIEDITSITNLDLQRQLTERNVFIGDISTLPPNQLSDWSILNKLPHGRWKELSPKRVKEIKNRDLIQSPHFLNEFFKHLSNDVLCHVPDNKLEFLEGDQFNHLNRRLQTCQDPAVLNKLTPQQVKDHVHTDNIKLITNDDLLKRLPNKLLQYIPAGKLGLLQGDQFDHVHDHLQTCQDPAVLNKLTPQQVKDRVHTDNIQYINDPTLLNKLASDLVQHVANTMINQLSPQQLRSFPDTDRRKQSPSSYSQQQILALTATDTDLIAQLTKDQVESHLATGLVQYASPDVKKQMTKKLDHLKIGDIPTLSRDQQLRLTDQARIRAIPYTRVPRMEPVHFGKFSVSQKAVYLIALPTLALLSLALNVVLIPFHNQAFLVSSREPLHLFWHALQFSGKSTPTATPTAT